MRARHHTIVAAATVVAFAVLLTAPLRGECEEGRRGTATPGATPSPAATHVPFAATSTHPFDDAKYWSSIFDDARLPAASVDVVLIVDTYHHLDARLGYLTRLRRALKAQGRVAIVDWQATPLPVGPPMEHKLARE